MEKSASGIELIYPAEILIHDPKRNSPRLAALAWAEQVANDENQHSKDHCDDAERRVLPVPNLRLMGRSPGLARLLEPQKASFEFTPPTTAG